MRFFDLVALILENLSRRKARVALTAVGVIIGTAAVVVLVSLAIGLQENATKQLYGISDLTQIQVYPNYGDSPTGPGGGGGVTFASGPGGSPAPANQKLLTTKALAEIGAIPGIAALIPRDSLHSGAELSVDGLVANMGLIGISVADLSLLGLKPQGGTLKLEKGTIIVGYSIPQNFYNPRQRPGQPPPEPPDLLDKQIKLSIIKWTQDGQETRKVVQVRVAGIIAESRSESDWAIYMPLDEVAGYNAWVEGKRVDRTRTGYEQLLVKADKVENVLGIADAIKALGYQAYAAQETVQQTSSFFLVLQVIFGGVGAIALLVAAIGIANTMTMAILERTREIGLMKAIGATNRDVLSVFLGEAAGIGFVGGVGGVALGWSVGQIINVLALVYFAGQATQQPGGLPPPSVAVVTPAWLPIFALLFATFIGLLSGLYPALRAATLVPVTALKYE
jgi:putative ABC transport system permease protein